MKEIDTNILENDWLTFVYKKPVLWKPIEPSTDLSGATIILQKIPGKADYVNGFFQMLVDHLKKNNQTATLLHLSDEFASDDISLYSNPVFTKIVRNYWRPDLPKSVIQLPLGYTNGRSNYAYTSAPSFEKRSTLWSFAGSLDRPGRAEALAILKTTANHVCAGKERWETPYAQDGPVYIETLRNSKFVPCFAGSAALESYRVYEALEHGAIPIYVPTKHDEYKEMYGQSPLLAFSSWEKAAQMLPLLAAKVDVMEKHRQSCVQWWNDKKQSLQTLLTAPA
jgi:hypothetical protein